MMKRKLSVLLTSVAIAALAQAQENTEAQGEAASPAASEGMTLTVPQVKAGECQALVVIPAKFEPRTEQVVIKDASKTYEIVPAEYEMTEEQVVIKPASKKLEIVPAVFETVEEQIEIEPAMTNQEVIPPQYNEVKEEVVAKPAYMTARSEGPARTFSSTGEALRMVEVPAEMASITKQVVQEEARINPTQVEAKFKTIKKQKLVSEETTREVEVPAEYETVKVKKLVKEAQQIEKEIPAEYAEVTKYEKISDAQVRWESVLCNDSVNSKTIEAVQAALKKEGYRVSVDGALGPGTMKALEAYQRKHNLGVGGVTRETLQSMGIEQ